MADTVGYDPKTGLETFDGFDMLKGALLQSKIPLAVNLTPTLAQEILDHDPVNRKVREGNLAKIVREIEGGHWDLNKSTAMKFLTSGRMADGQHRCKAVVKTGVAVPVWMCVVTDTLGVDEGANRTLNDHLQINYGLDEATASLASTVTKALCHVYAPGNREYLDYFKEHETFIMESVRKPMQWLEEHGATIAAIFKPPVVATLRARAIRENEEPTESVDQLLYDAINNGKTAPDGSPRRALAEQFYKAMDEAGASRKGKPKDKLRWLLNALRFQRENQIRNIVSAKHPADRRKRKPNRTSERAAA